MKAKDAEKLLREFGLGFPGAYEDFPWGERVLKVNKKVFVFMGISDGGLSMSTKLPDSGMAALSLPFTQPTGYGLGKSGWVSSRFEAKDSPPIEVLKAWITESYRAVAPVKLVKALDGAAPKKAAPAAKKKKAAPAAPKKKPKKASAPRARGSR
ncbi:MAG: MmcQ/YjbR family DNA-binding protein [Myxococcota bacterium]